MRERVAKMEHPIFVDETPFGKWLRSQSHRKDRVGGLARVACKDPFWPGGGTRAKTTEYYKKMGAREFVLGSVKLAWDEFERTARRDQARERNRQKNQQRKATRRSQRR